MDKILIALSNEVNTCLINHLLKDNYDIYRYEQDMPLYPWFDLIISDGKMLTVINEKYQDLKSSRLFRPILLVTTRKGMSLISNGLWQIIDNMIVTPVMKIELHMCVEMLLRSRRQALKLCEMNGIIENDNAHVNQNSALMTDYFACVSHELRSPLSVIISGLDMIAEFVSSVSDYPTEFRHTLNVSKQNCRRLTRIINNLLDISKLRTGDLNPSLRNIDPSAAISQIIASVRNYFKRKEISIKFSNDSGCSSIAADDDMFNRVILNLLSNAFKFTPRGGEITVSLSDARRPGNVIICVSDTGIGIPLDKQQDIFDPFMQADKTLSKRTEGCGLGLSLVKSFVERHGGRVWLESKVGIGSSFSFELPVKVVPEPPPMIFGPELSERIACEFSDT